MIVWRLISASSDTHGVPLELRPLSRVVGLEALVCAFRLEKQIYFVTQPLCTILFLMYLLQACE